MTKLADPSLTISKGGLRLRYWKDSDLQGIVKEMQDPEIARWIQHIPIPYGGGNAREFIRLMIAERDAGKAVHLAIEDVTHNEVMGGIALTNIDKSEGTAEIGYWVSARHRRQGVATRATKLLADWAFAQPELERLTLFTDPDNVRSQRVAEKCGFHREGLLRGHTPARGGWPSRLGHLRTAC